MRNVVAVLLRWSLTLRDLPQSPLQSLYPCEGFGAVWVPKLALANSSGSNGRQPLFQGACHWITVVRPSYFTTSPCLPIVTDASE